MRITTEAFDEGRPIPRKYTVDGQDASPPLRWSGVPTGAAELALVVEDPDAPQDRPFVHWVACNIPTSLASLPEAMPRARHIEQPAAINQGRNDFGQVGYGGPAPPRGHGKHHYHFHLYAVDAPLKVASGCDAQELRRAMRGHVLAEAECVGTYER